MLDIERCEETFEVSSKMTKAELLETVKKLVKSNAELNRNNDALIDASVEYIDKIDKLEKEVTLLRRVINTAIDLKELLDAAEDVAEELAEVCEAFCDEEDK